MGTEIINEDGIYVKRFYGGKERGVMFSVIIDKEFTKSEFKDFLKKCLEAII